MVKKSSVTTKMPAVFRGKKCVIHGCLSKKASSSARSAASSNTMERYRSELTIAIQARNRQREKTDVMPIAESKEKITIRKCPFLFLCSQRRAAFFTTLSAFVLKGQLQSRTELDHFAILNLHIHLHHLGDAQIT